MPRDVESADETDTLLERSRHKVKRLWNGFVDFAFEGNVLQIAFGLMCVSLSLPLPSFLTLAQLDWDFTTDNPQPRLHLHRPGQVLRW